MRRFASFPIWVALLLLPLAALAQTSRPTLAAPHLSASLLVPPQQIYPGQSFTAGLEFQMQPGWHIYWINAGDSGEPPSIRWSLPKGISADPMLFPPPQRLPLGPLMDFGYQNQVVFPIPIHVAADFHPGSPQVRLAAHISWLVCAQVCIPGRGDLSLHRAALRAAPAISVTDPAAQALVSRYQALLPKPLPAGDAASFRSTPQGFILDVRTGSRVSSAKFFPLDQSVIANAAPQPSTPQPNGVQLRLAKDASLQSPPPHLNGLLELPGGMAYLIHATPGFRPRSAAATTGLSRIAGVLGFAFLGGMILNLMPCVFPVLFIKGLALVQSSQLQRRHLRAHGWVYALGILVSFWAVVAVLLVLRAAGRQLGWGFQFQSPVFVALMAMLLFFLGLALAGQFEIGLSLTSAGGSLAAKHGYAGSFFTGVLAMVVATPCTAPFMGAAVGYALAHSAAVSFAVFTALALGLAAPYLLLAYFPGWARILPKPGAWMETLKQAVSIPTFAFTIWLVWVFTQIAGVTAMSGLLAAFLLLAIAGWTLGRWPARSLPRVIAACILAAAVALPVWAVRAVGAPAQSDAGNTAQRIRQGDLASAVLWQPFTPQLLAADRAQGRPVFVDFTASWCLSCQVNERLILDNPEVRRKLLSSGIVTLRADWTDQNPAITQALAALGRSGVPTYAIYPADPAQPPRVLPEVLTRGIVLDALNTLPRALRTQALASNP